MIPHSPIGLILLHPERLHWGKFGEKRPEIGSILCGDSSVNESLHLLFSPLRALFNERRDSDELYEVFHVAERGNFVEERGEEEAVA